MLAFESEFGWPVAEHVRASVDGCYTREINNRIFNNDERKSV